MERMKSAKEIALERVEKLGRISPEELKEERNRKCAELGRQLTLTYLTAHNPGEIEGELLKYSGEERNMVERSLWQDMVCKLELGNHDHLSFLLELASQMKNEIIGKAGPEISDLFCSYQEAVERDKREIRNEGKNVLHGLRISGDAVGEINLRAKEEWKGKIEATALPYEQELGRIKEGLLQTLC
jgi:hypothetical protein